jgi:hypothetical protein
MNSSCCRQTAWIALALFALPAAAAAQGFPQSGASGNPVCVRLESQLASIDRAGADPARAEQARRIEESLGKQQAELDRVQAQYQRLGCQPPSLFSIFVTQAPQCGPLNGQIQQMRGNIDRTQSDLQRTRRGGEDDMQRQAVIGALAQNNCGPQYRAAAAAAVPQQRGFFETLFGGPNVNIPPPAPGDYPQVGAGGYRTLCVRTCDGFYFPISNSTSSTRFAEDEQTCQKLCPATEAVLYSHRNPGEDVAQAVANNGRTYRELPNAFRYRREFIAACSCRLPGQSWADALGQIKDSTVERGDIVVTEEKAKAMNQPRSSDPRTPARPDARRAAPATPAPPTAAAPADTGSVPDADPAKRSVRAVGPTFIPTR